jgi:hypothetical protein
VLAELAVEWCGLSKGLLEFRVFHSSDLNFSCFKAVRQKPEARSQKPEARSQKRLFPAVFSQLAARSSSSGCLPEGTILKINFLKRYFYLIFVLHRGNKL